MCDPRDGNPTVNDTTVAWAGRCDPNFNEFFYIDVKLVTGLCAKRSRGTVALS